RRIHLLVWVNQAQAEKPLAYRHARRDNESHDPLCGHRAVRSPAPGRRPRPPRARHDQRLWTDPLPDRAPALRLRGAAHGCAPRRGELGTVLASLATSRPWHQSTRLTLNPDAADPLP